MLWLQSQASCDQDKGQHTELPQQHHGCKSNHLHRAKILHFYPRPCAFDQVQCFLLFCSTENRVEDTQLHHFISLGLFSFYFLPIKTHWKNQTGPFISFQELISSEELQVPRRRPAPPGWCFQNPELWTIKKLPPCS